MVLQAVPRRGRDVSGGRAVTLFGEAHGRGGARPRAQADDLPRRPHDQHRRADEDLRGRRDGRRQVAGVGCADLHRGTAVQPFRPHARQAAPALVPAGSTEHPAAGLARAPARRRSDAAAAPRGDRPRLAGRDGGRGVPLEGDRQEPVHGAAGRARRVWRADDHRRGRRARADRLRPGGGGFGGTGTCAGRHRGGRNACGAADAQRDRLGGGVHGAAGVRRRALPAEHFDRRGGDAVSVPHRRRPHGDFEPRVRGEGPAHQDRGAHGGGRALCLAGGRARVDRPAREIARQARRVAGAPSAGRIHGSGCTGGGAVHQRIGGRSERRGAEPSQPARQLRADRLGDRLPWRRHRVQRDADVPRLRPDRRHDPAAGVRRAHVPLPDAAALPRSCRR